MRLFKKKDNPDFDNKQDMHLRCKNHEENGYGHGLNLLTI